MANTRQDKYFYLDPANALFVKLSDKSLLWWRRLCNDKELYVNIRKGNKISVYYKGAAVIREMICDNGNLTCDIDDEYWKGISAKKSPQNIEKNLPKVKQNIDNFRNKRKKTPPEGACEKEIQWEIYRQGEYIDTEYAYFYPKKIRQIRIDFNGLQMPVDLNGLQIRIDLVRMKENNEIEFVELKRISDGRMLSDKIKKRT